MHEWTNIIYDVNAEARFISTKYTSILVRTHFLPAIPKSLSEIPRYVASVIP